MLNRMVRASVVLVVCLCWINSVAAAGYEIGAYYFPGWHSTSSYWRDLKGLPGSRSPGKSWPDREPLLGHYPEEQLWVAEKHIEWAASYGITFFAYDWYWDGASPMLNHAITANLRARNRDRIKYCLLWANHFAIPRNASEFNAMVDYWLTNYLNDPQYLKVDGKPVVIIFSPQMLSEKASRFGANAADLLEGARAKARAKGLRGIYFVGTATATSSLVKDYLPTHGYDAITAYNYHSKGFSGEYTGSEPEAANYLELYEGYKSQWSWILQNSPLPYFVPMTAGWDSRPWGSDTAHDRCSSTPQSFKRMLTDAKTVMDANPDKTKKIGLVYAWNELGEGGYIEPTKKWRFEYLRAIYDVFGR